jgi:hypothetical protein
MNDISSTSVICFMGAQNSRHFKSLFQGRVGGVGNAIKNKENRTVPLGGGEKLKNFLFLYLYNVGDNVRYPEAIFYQLRDVCVVKL